MALLQSASNIGYTSLQSGSQVSRLLRDIYTYAFIFNALSDQYQVMSQLDKIYLTQAVDGLHRSAHLLPDHVRGSFARSIQVFSDRLKRGDSVRSSALLINISAILQPPIERPSLPPTEAPALAAMLADSIPDFRRAPDVFVPASSPETAFMARFTDRSRPENDRREYRSDRRDFRTDTRPPPCLDVRRDFRPDTRPASRQDLRGAARSDSRHDSRHDSRLDEYRDSRHAVSDDRPDSSVTLEDLQKSMASMQSLIDKHARQARQAQNSPSRRDRAAFVVQAHDSYRDELAYTAFIADHAEFIPGSSERPSYTTHPRPLDIRTTIDSD